MKIVHIITTLESGGAENQLLLLASQQTKQGLTVSVVPLKGKLDLIDKFTREGVKVVLDLHNKHFLQQLIELRRLLKQSQCVVHCHLPQAELVASLSNVKSYLVSRHFGGQFRPSGPVFLSSLLSRIALRNCKCLISISQSVQKSLLHLREVPRKLPITVIPYGFDAQAFLSKGNQDLVGQNVKSATLRLVTFARLSEEKDLEVLLRAFAMLSKTRNVQLSIFGEGRQENHLRKVGNSLGLDMSKILRGKTGNVCFEMLHADAVVLTSKFEGFGMVLLEAMAVHKPIISSNIDTAIEVLGSEGAGVFFMAGDHESLAHTIDALDSLLSAEFIEAQVKRLKFFDIKKTERAIYQEYLRFR